MAMAISTLSACAPEPTPTETQASSSPTATVDPTLVPTAAPTLVEVSAKDFYQADRTYLFKVGDGPAWCSIDPGNDQVVCEINEVSAEYEPVDVPASCDYSYGYQLRLTRGTPAEGNPADFLCSGGPYADPSRALKLASGSQIKVGPFTCFVDEFAARCDNQDGSWIVMGPKAWALGNP